MEVVFLLLAVYLFVTISILPPGDCLAVLRFNGGLGRCQSFLTNHKHKIL